jgi:folate-dependent phosphoribosylglycinamide formyltransferase PurN
MKPKSSQHALMDPQAVVSDVPTCGGVQYAQEHGVPTLTYPIPKKGGFAGLSAEELVHELKEKHKTDFVILAGYLKVLFSLLTEGSSLKK